VRRSSSLPRHRCRPLLTAIASLDIEPPGGKSRVPLSRISSLSGETPFTARPAATTRRRLRWKTRGGAAEGGPRRLRSRLVDAHVPAGAASNGRSRIASTVRSARAGGSDRGCRRGRPPPAGRRRKRLFDGESIDESSPLQSYRRRRLHFHFEPNPVDGSLVQRTCFPATFGMAARTV